MSSICASIDIDAPMERVWQTVMDPSRLQDWVTIHRSVGKVSTPLKKGSTMEQVLHMRGMSFKVKWKLADVSKPNLAQWEGSGPARSEARIRYELSDNGQGGTHFAYTNEFTAPGGMLGQAASRIVVGAASEREANNSLRQLKQLLEQN
jgi:carbon monoxide dehydrogenase subunit G